ncbi:hypothetical protein GCM10009678_65630 [Actinomadura kijaniata]|uniref:Methylamine utilisation protein MauE domain-containing protein n=1 Tax=Actinomadura namibiensis TaxID=182080 RepID=A0A7W3LPE5_ACTNM|nr:MauE/DoxX family redox-associated membrane protein [Actinomadura namibiensis]MBA8951844.1 hypothetical protein [Actinomadura namibiensis]
MGYAIAAALVTLVLISGAAGHALKPFVLRDALRAHATVPERFVRPLAVLVPVIEAVPAGLGAFGLLGGHDGALTAAMVCAAALMAGYGAYTWHVTRTSEAAVPCGCSAAGTPMTGWVPLRAVALAAVAAVAAGGAAHAASVDAPDLLVAVLAGATLGALVWELPALAAPRPAN